VRASLRSWIRVLLLCVATLAALLVITAAFVIKVTFGYPLPWTWFGLGILMLSVPIAILVVGRDKIAAAVLATLATGVVVLPHVADMNPRFEFIRLTRALQPGMTKEEVHTLFDGYWRDNSSEEGLFEGLELETRRNGTPNLVSSIEVWKHWGKGMYIAADNVVVYYARSPGADEECVVESKLYLD
jgi:hypothetical protein